MPTQVEKDEFSQRIEILAEEYNTTCLETVCLYCESANLEPEVAGTLVNESLKAKLYHEAMDLNYIEKSSKLPL